MCNQYLPAKKLMYLLFFSALLFTYSSTLSQAPVLQFNLVAAGLDQPIDVVGPGDGSNRLFVVEKTGKIRIISGGLLQTSSFLDLGAIISTTGEEGLLSIVFHPSYLVNGYFFVYYINLAGDIEIARYQRSTDPLVALPGSGQVLLTIHHPGQSNHNGGKLNFGADGNLYFATGDGGGGGDVPNNAQNSKTLLGKMLRINVDSFSSAPPYYTIPAGNPYSASIDTLPEIWAFGLRNPFRWSFDRLTQDMWLADVGQNFWEEVNFRNAGSTGGINYGWRCYEATHVFNTSGCLGAGNYVFPIFEYDHDVTTGGSSITGGYVYRGTNYPALYGYYIVADFSSSNVWLIKPTGSGGWTNTRQAGLSGNVTGFGEDANGELYAVSISGNVYEVGLMSTLAVKLISFTVSTENSMHLLRWQTAGEQDLKQFEIQSSDDGLSFRSIGTLPPASSNNSGSYQFSTRMPTNDRAFYRLKIIDNQGKVEYSAIVNTGNSGQQVVTIAQTLITNNQLNIRLNKAFTTLQVLDMNGRVIKTRNLGQGIGAIHLDVSDLTRGMYIIRLAGRNPEVLRKIMIQ